MCIYIVLLLVPLLASIYLGVLYNREKNRADRLEEATLAEMVALWQQNQEEGENNFTLPADVAENTVATPSFPYQAQYPHLYAERPPLQVAEDKVCYLTFDDGPSDVTRRILAVLEEEDIKATFFVTGKNSEINEDVLRDTAAAGHTIGVHSYSHNYEEIYASVENFLADFDLMYGRILEVTGKPPEIFRFPGGSINTYNQQVYPAMVAEMTRRGFVFYDWNAAGDDAVAGGIGQQAIVSNVMKSATGKGRLVVLLHDRIDNGSTAAALPAIISGLREQGYRFAPLTNAVEPITYFRESD